MTLFMIVTLTTLLTVTAGNRLADSIYNTVSSDTIHSCFRRLNGTTSVGCSSSIRGDVGVLVYLDSASDLANLTDPRFSPYIVLINPSLLSGPLVQHLADTGLVSGLILPGVEDPAGSLEKKVNGKYRLDLLRYIIFSLVTGSYISSTYEHIRNLMEIKSNIGTHLVCIDH